MMIMFQMIMLMNADHINDTSNGFRLLHQNDIKTSLQRIKRLEKPTDSLKLRIKRPEQRNDSLKLNLISTRWNGKSAAKSDLFYSYAWSEAMNAPKDIRWTKMFCQKSELIVPPCKILSTECS